MTISDESTARNVASKNANLICKAIAPTFSMPTSAIASFNGKFVFDSDAMKYYIEKNFIHARSASTEKNQGSNIETLVQNVSASFSAEGSHGFKAAGAVSVSLATDFNVEYTSSESVSFSQRRLMAKFGNISLPSAFVRDNLRALVKPEMLSAIDGIDSIGQAENFVKEVGVVYISSASFGATLTMSSTSKGTSFRSVEALNAAVDAEMSFLTSSASTENKFNTGSNKGKENESLEVQIRAVGGDPTSILKGDQDKWIESTEAYPTVTNYRLAPISNLAQKNSDAEKFLQQAVKEVCDLQTSMLKATVVPPLEGTYSIRSFDQGDGLYLNVNVSQKSNGGKIHQWAHPQKWVLEQTNGDGEPIVTLKSTESNLYLNIDISQRRNGGKVHQWDYPQKWMILEVGKASDGSRIVTIKSLESNLYLNINISQRRNGGTIFQWGYPQHWKLVREE